MYRSFIIQNCAFVVVDFFAFFPNLNFLPITTKINMENLGLKIKLKSTYIVWDVQRLCFLTFFVYEL